jgi:outer membrane protein assembly factor BamB
MLFRSLLCVCFVLTASFIYAGETWSHFRGDIGDGRADNAQLPLEIGEGLNVKWKVPIAGRGWSSPVIWKDQIWLTTATEDGVKMSAICIDRRTGQTLHNIVVFENALDDIRFRHPTNSYASPTPAIEAGTLYVHFGSYGTAAIDTATGKKKWERRDFQCNHWRGPAASPVIDGDRIIISYDGFDVQFVVALDKQTGKTIWKTDRNIDYGTDNGDRKKAYSTPMVIEVAGKRQAISPSATETISYDLATGAVLWRVNHGGMNAAARPLFGHGLLYISAGDGARAMVAVRPSGTGDVTETHIEWEFSKAVPKRASQLLIKDHLYMMNDAGVATCLEAKTGKLVWQMRAGTGEFRASPVFANGNMYCFAVEGGCVVLRCSPEFRKISSGKFESGFHASPAVVGNSLYIRSITDLYCIEQN